MKNKETICAIYARFSSDDKEDDNDISRSVANQLKYASEYAKKNNFKIYDTYYDMQITGTTLNRPGLKSMLRDMEKGLFNTIIVKDLSRFSRNFVDASKYIDEVFPQNKIRFISIMDHYDSANGEDDSIVFRNFFNGMYSKDAKRKIHRSFKDRIDKKYLVSIPIYGYKKDKNKNIIIDDEAAKIIKRIYKEFIEEHKNYAKIAKGLEQNKIYIPSAHKYYNLKQKISTKFMSGVINNPYKWDATFIKRVLHNYEYCGHAVNETWSKKSKSTDRTNIIVENTHPAIIDEETFALAANLTKTVNKNPERLKYIPNILYCKCHPKRVLTFYHYRGSNNKPLYKCNCCNSITNRIDAEDIIEVLYQDVCSIMNEILNDKEAYFEKFKAMLYSKESYYTLKKQIEESNKKFKTIYEKYKANKLSKESYIELRNKLTSHIYELNNKLELFEYEKLDIKIIEMKYNEFVKEIDAEALTNLSKPEIIKYFISRVYVDFETKPINIDVKYKFQI